MKAPANKDAKAAAKPGAKPRAQAAAPARPPAATPSREFEPVTQLKGVGEALAQRLAKLGVETVQDLLFLLPTRYEDRTQVVPIGSLQPGDRAVIEGTIALAEVVFRPRRVLLARVADNTGSLTLRFFHFSTQQQEQLKRGVALRCFGEVRRAFGVIERIDPFDEPYNTLRFIEHRAQPGMEGQRG